jgi:hypothetical protein
LKGEIDLFRCILAGCLGSQRRKTTRERSLAALAKFRSQIAEFL